MSSHFFKSVKPLLTLGLLLLGVVTSLVEVQAVNVDSLRTAAAEMEDSGEKGDIYLGLARHFIYLEPDSAMVYSVKLRELGQRLEVDSLQGLGYVTEGVLFIVKGSDNKAIQSFRKGLDYFNEENNRKRIMTIRINLATIFLRRGELDQSERELKEAEKIFTPDSNRNVARVLYNNLGEVAGAKGNHQEAIQYFRTSEKYCREGDIRSLSMVQINLGRVSNGMQDYRGALEYFSKAKQLLQGSEFTMELEQTFTGLCNTNLSLGNIAQAKQDLDSTKFYEAFYSSPVSKKSLKETEAKYREKTGDYQSALALFKELKAAEDSLAQADREADLAFIESELDFELKEMEISVLEKNNALEREKRERAMLYTGALATGLALILLVLVMFIILLRGRGRANRELSAKNKVIKEKNELLEERQAKLEILNQEKDGLIGIVAHDLKSPLNKGLALMSMIREGGEITPAQENAIEMVAHSNQAGLKLIENLLELNSVEEGGNSFTKERVLLSDLFSEIGGTFQGESIRKGITLEMVVEPLSLEIESDPLSLSRMLENLISNALKFSKPGTQVKVSATATDQSVTLQITDQGPGISAEDQTKLFTKFQRLTARPTGGESSTGLGLAIVKGLVEKLHGTIQVQSTLGKGTTFTLQFPS